MVWNKHHSVREERFSPLAHCKVSSKSSQSGTNCSRDLDSLLVRLIMNEANKDDRHVVAAEASHWAVIGKAAHHQFFADNFRFETLRNTWNHEIGDLLEIDQHEAHDLFCLLLNYNGNSICFGGCWPNVHLVVIFPPMHQGDLHTFYKRYYIY